MDKCLMPAVVMSLLLLAAPARALQGSPKTYFLPENDMRIPVGDIRAKGIDQAGFNAVLDRVQEIYEPIIRAHGGRFVINRLWDDPTVNASAMQAGGDWIINMYGGLARHQAITQDAFALVACHELGHHLGGFPKIGGEEWASNEGEADYYSTLKCARRVLSGANPPATVDPLAKESCSASFREGAGRNRCESSVMGGLSLASLLAELRSSPQPSLTTPDASVVDETDDSHPAAQCRLDTYYQGALCTKAIDEELSNSDPAPGACTTAAGFKTGYRPLCWFKPPAGAEQAAVAARPALPSAKAIQDSLEALRAALSGHGR